MLPGKSPGLGSASLKKRFLAFDLKVVVSIMSLSGVRGEGPRAEGATFANGSTQRTGVASEADPWTGQGRACVLYSVLLQQGEQGPKGEKGDPGVPGEPVSVLHPAPRTPEPVYWSQGVHGLRGNRSLNRTVSPQHPQ